MIWRKGEPIYNLEVQIAFDPITIQDQKQLLSYGDALFLAQELFCGQKHVTERGYILNGYKNHERWEGNNTPLTYHQATLHFNSNYEALLSLKLVMKGRKQYSQEISLVKLQCPQDEVQFVKAEGSHLYLPLVREKLNLK